MNIKRPDFDFENVPRYFMDSQDLIWLLQFNENDAYLAMRLCFQTMFIPLTKQLTNLAGNLWGRTMTGARAERNEFLLLHEFYKNGYILPDKQTPFSNAKEVVSKGKKPSKESSISSSAIAKITENQEVDDVDDDGFFLILL
jgi:DNA polymerase alpha subunit A